MPLVLVELSTRIPAPPTCLQDVPESLGQFQHRKPPYSQFVFSFHALLFLLHGIKKVTPPAHKNAGREISIPNPTRA